MRRFLARYWLRLLPFVAFNALLLPHIASMPLWDAHWFFESALNSAMQPLDIKGYLWFNHPSLLFGPLFALPQIVDMGNVVLLQGMSLLLGNAAIVAFFFSAQRFLQGRRFAPELATLAFALHPVILGNTLHFTLDLGVLWFFLITFALLTHGRIGWAALSGLMLSFTKESGVALFGLLILCEGLCGFAVKKDMIGSMRRMFRERSVLLIPLTLFFLYVIVQQFLWHQFPLFNYHAVSSTRLNLFELMLRFEWSRDFRIMLGDLFVLNFQWVAIFFLLLSSGILLWNVLFPRRGVHRVRHERATRDVLFLLLLFLSSFFLLTRFIPFNNVRYLLPLYPLILLLTFRAMTSAFRSATSFMVVAGIILFTEIMGIYDSIDPLSRRIFGTAPFGSHSLYRMGHLGVPGNCCRIGRDELVYNLQYRMLASLQDALYRKIQPTKDTVIVLPPGAWKGFENALDPHTFKRTFQEPSILPRYRYVPALLKESPLPQTITFLQFAPFDSEPDKEALLKHYNIQEEFIISSYGFTAPVTVMHRKR